MHQDNREGLELIMAALEKCGHKDKVCYPSEAFSRTIPSGSKRETRIMRLVVWLSGQVVLAMDCAASEFYVAEDKSYDLNYKVPSTYHFVYLICIYCDWTIYGRHVYPAASPGPVG
jgi:hypothetical protein